MKSNDVTMPGCPKKVLHENEYPGAEKIPAKRLSLNRTYAFSSVGFMGLIS
jgi:hypothetical protein